MLNPGKRREKKIFSASKYIKMDHEKILNEYWFFNNPVCVIEKEIMHTNKSDSL